ncbi:hypothetical protein AJ79_06962 [Helicocarpus griseus UAMH5409]|uniref:Uncharacterized protein n=1 Tax=Helicocarpus griseus UAMH5409 TaxID=1447875 RepID=A0A2B7X837_9EURO|nr:hypothetical protein AJ79_06962 [Helicocarpus griseus UAMH5409]
MNWQCLPAELQLHVLENVVLLEGDDDIEYDLDEKAWWKNIRQYMLVCKNWKTLICDAMIGAAAIAPTAIPSLVLVWFNEEIAQGVLSRALPKLEVSIRDTSIPITQVIRATDYDDHEEHEWILPEKGEDELGYDLDPKMSYHEAVRERVAIDAVTYHFVLQHYQSWLRKCIQRNFASCVEVLAQAARTMQEDMDQLFRIQGPEKYRFRQLGLMDTVIRDTIDTDSERGLEDDGDNDWDYTDSEITDSTNDNDANSDKPSSEVHDTISPLEYALDKGHLEIATLLVTHGANLRTQSNYIHGNTIGDVLLCVAARDNNIKLANVLLDRDVPIEDPRGHDEENPLACALLENHIDMAVFLLDRGASFFNDLSPVVLPMCAAAKSCSVETVRMLIGRGADVNASTKLGERPLKYALAYNEPVARFLIEEQGVLILKTDIHSVVEKSQPISFLQFLIDHAGGNKQLKGNGGNWAARFALDTAAAGGKLEVVQYLLQSIKPEWLNLEAVSNNHIEIVKLLLDAGADPYTESGFNRSSLYLAAENGSLELVKILVGYGMLTSGIHNSLFPLKVAVKKGHLDVVRFLLENGAVAHKSHYLETLRGLTWKTEMLKLLSAP